MTKQEIEQLAEKTLLDHGMLRIPVPIDSLAHRLSLTTEAAALGKDVSGMLVVESGRGAIGYNSDHAPVRQRFTIGHEIAHFLLHLKKNRRSQLFIDRYVAFRSDAVSSTGSDHDEVEANRLGAALLMPGSLLREQIRKLSLDLDDEEAIFFLAKQFHVSTIAMTNRLTSLGLLR